MASCYGHILRGAFFRVFPHFVTTIASASFQFSSVRTAVGGRLGGHRAMARRWLLLLLPFLVGVATKAKADGDGTKGPWHQRQQGPSQGPIGGSKGTGKGSGGAKDEGAGGFRTILHYISHKKLQGAKAGLQKHGNAAVTVDKPGHWHSQAGQDVRAPRSVAS